ncbi:MAG: hypothetical protein WC358_05880 [Ignavibacteria bacterium]|jgi:hypothetical protein
MKTLLLFLAITIALPFINKSDCYSTDNNFCSDSLLQSIDFRISQDSTGYHYVEKVIIKMYPIHCKRGPQGCDKCKEYTKEMKYCFIGLLNRGGIYQRPLIQLNLAGEKVWYEFDQFKIFDSEEEALEYSKESSIKIIEKEE